MAPTLTISGLTTNGAITDLQTIQPFSSVTIADSFSGDLVSATISFAAANGTLTGAALWPGVVNAGVVTYTVSAATPSALQSELQGLTFTPTAQQAAVGTSVTTAFDLTVSDVTALAPTIPTLLQTLSSGVSYPQSVATDAAGDVFVANGGNNTVEEFNASGVLVHTLSSGVSIPNSVATDAAGDVFVVNFENNTVEEFNASGVLVRTLSGGVSEPNSVATDAAGDVFVANSGTNTVEEFNASGVLVRTLSSGVSEPLSVATDAAGDVFVANRANNTVEEFNASGVLVRTLSIGVSEPFSVATDAAGDVFVANSGNNTVEEFNASGALVQTLSSGVGAPRSVATDSAGDVFVANYGNGTVEEFNASGALVQTLSSGISDPSVATDAAGDVFVANFENNTVEEFKVSQLTSVSNNSTQVAVTQAAPTLTISGLTTDGAITDLQTIQPFSSVTIADSFSSDLVSATISFAAANGTLTGAGLWPGVVNAGAVTYTLSAATPSALQSELQGLTFTPTAQQAAVGTSVTTAFDLTVSDVTALSPTPPTLLQTLSSGVSDPQSVAMDAAGDVFVANGGNSTVEEFNASGALVRTLSSGVSFPYSVATDAADDVFVANFENNTVEEFNASGALVSTLSSGVINPRSLATDAAGDVFVANDGNNTIEEFNASGALVLTLSSGVGLPTGVATDTAGDVFVGNPGNNTVEEFNASGALVRTLSSGVSNPDSVATDAAGDVFVANHGNNTVEEFNASGALVRTLSSGVSIPYGLATDTAGDVFVANGLNNTVEEFNASGALVQTLSSGVSAPNSVATDAAGDVFVANGPNNTVEKFKVSQLTSISDASTEVAVLQVGAPTITDVTTALQTTTSEAPVSPFANVVVGDVNSGASDTLTIAIAGSGGTLSGAGALANGVYTLAGSASAITTQLEAVSFTPAAGLPGTTNDSTFTLTDTSNAYATATVDSQTEVADADPALAPTLTDATAALQTTTSEAPVSPFANVVVGDVNSGASDTLTIAISGSGGTLSGAGALANGVYTLAGSASAITTQLEAVTFTPTAGLPGTTNDSTFTLTDTSNAYATATVDSQTEVADADPALAPTLTDVTTALQTTTSEAPVSPFANVVVGDVNSGASDTLTIAISGSGGTLSGAGALANGVYTLAGSASAITTQLEAVTFTPAAGLPGTTNDSTFTLTDTSNAYATATVDSQTEVADADPALAPTLTDVTTALQTTTSEASVSPFANVVVGDVNSGASDTLTIAISGSGGTLSGAGALANGVYTLTGSASAITTQLEAVTFTPAAGLPGTTNDSTFTLTDASNAYATATVDSQTEVADADPALAPTLTDVTTALQTTTSEAPVSPFANVVVGDVNSGASDTLTIAISGSGGTLSGAGALANGVYTLAGSASAITTQLEAVTFTPAAGLPGTTNDSAFTLTDTSNAYATATVDSQTEVADADPALAPMAPTGLTDAAIVNGYVNAANDKSTQALSGKAAAGSTVTVYDENNKLGTTPANATTGVWSFTVGVLGAGPHSLTATATNSAGSVSLASTALTFTVDTTIPPAPTGLADLAIANGYVNAANDTSAQTLSGTAAAGSTVTVFDENKTLGTTTANATTGAWSFTLGVLGSGAHSLTATATDQAGNVSSASKALIFTVDTLTPPQPIITNSVLSGGSWALSGSAKAGAKVNVYNGSALLGTTIANSSGAWTYKTGQSNGAIRDFYATVTDAYGNVSAPAAAWYEGTPGNDTFQFASEAAFASAGSIFGNGGLNTIDITTPASLTDTVFAHAYNFFALELTGSSSAVLGVDAAAAGIRDVVTGAAATTISDTNNSSLTVSAAALPTGSVLTLSGRACFSVSGLQANLNAAGVTGSLSVATAATPGLSIATGSGSSSLNASAMAAGQTLTLTGDSAAAVQIGGNLAAGGDSGNLTVMGTGSGKATIALGGGNDKIIASQNGDTFVAGAGADTFDVAGHTSSDTFTYTSAAESLNIFGHSDLISGFSVAGSSHGVGDVINFSAIAGVTAIQGLLLLPGQKVAAHSVAWVSNPLLRETVVLVNSTSGALSETNSGLMAIDLAGSIALSGSNFKV